MEGNTTTGRRYINPLTDFGFKKIFGDEEIMREFLNDLIEPEAPIVKVIFLDKEMLPETKYERGVIYDMRCKLSTGEEIMVEMQNRGQDYFTDRINYYLARAIATQGDKGNYDWKQKPIFHKLENITDMAALTPEERDLYQISLDSFRTNMAVMEHERNEGREERRKEGIAMGLAEGITESEKAKAFAIACNLKAMNVPLETIIKATGLTAGKMEKL